MACLLRTMSMYLDIHLHKKTDHESAAPLDNYAVADNSKRQWEASAAPTRPTPRSSQLLNQHHYPRKTAIFQKYLIQNQDFGRRKISIEN